MWWTSCKRCGVAPAHNLRTKFNELGEEEIFNVCDECDKVTPTSPGFDLTASLNAAAVAAAQKMTDEARARTRDAVVDAPYPAPPPVCKETYYGLPCTDPRCDVEHKHPKSLRQRVPF